MKKTTLILGMLIAWIGVEAQTYNAAYVKQLYAKYPTVKSNFCSACKLWVNPYYKSIADTLRHMPLVEFEIYHKGTKLSIIPRIGIYASWHGVTGKDDEGRLYTASNKIGKGEIAKGHVNCWILNSFSADAAILSDTYTYNAAMECQGQNVGTEIATENIERKLALTTDVKQWGGCYGTQGDVGGIDIPAYYWKVVVCNGITTCYWMPNQQNETQDLLPKRIVTYQQLVKNLGFDPEKILN